MIQRCRHCGRDYPNERQRRIHPCPNRNAAERAAQLRWPTEPVEQWMLARFGEYDRTRNPDGYCAGAVERATGVLASTWLHALRTGCGLTDQQADRIGVRLGNLHERFWPGWHDALEVTDEDDDWYGRWRRTGAVA
jgi:hypothetical protein